MARSIVQDIEAVEAFVPVDGPIAYPDLLQAVNDDPTIENKKQALINVLQGGRFEVAVKLNDQGKSIAWLSRKGGA